MLSIEFGLWFFGFTIGLLIGLILGEIRDLIRIRRILKNE